MTRPAIIDPTAGERAREILEHQGAANRIQDPTDRRYGGEEAEYRGQAGNPARVSDPTDPDCGAAA